MDTALKNIMDEYDVGIVKLVVGIPYKIGCGLGGGSWEKVYDIFKKYFDNNEHADLIICRKEE